MPHRNIYAATPPQQSQSDELATLEKGAGVWTFLLFAVTVASVLFTCVWILFTVGESGSFSIAAVAPHALVVGFLVAGSFFCAIATWCAYQKSEALTKTEVFGFGMVSLLSALCALAFWVLATTFMR